MEQFGQGETARGRGVEHLGQGRRGVGLSMGWVVYARSRGVTASLDVEMKIRRTRKDGKNLVVIANESCDLLKEKYEVLGS